MKAHVRVLALALASLIATVSLAFAATNGQPADAPAQIFQVASTATQTITPTVTVTASITVTVTDTITGTTASMSSTPTATLVLTMTPTVTVTVQVTDTLTTTLNLTSTLLVTPTNFPTFTPTATSTPLPLPTDPNLAREPNGKWVFISPGTTHWYKMNDTRLELNVWLDANGQQGIELAIFAPEQKDLYGKPIGRGSFNKFQPAHDLYWSGSTRAFGTWYARVTNNSSISISYSLGYKRTLNSVAGRCSECHGFEIEWDRCVSHGTNWCEELKNEYGQK